MYTYRAVHVAAFEQRVQHVVPFAATSTAASLSPSRRCRTPVLSRLGGRAFQLLHTHHRGEGLDVPLLAPPLLAAVVLAVRVATIAAAWLLRAARATLVAVIIVFAVVLVLVCWAGAALLVPDLAVWRSAW